MSNKGGYSQLAETSEDTTKTEQARWELICCAASY